MQLFILIVVSVLLTSVSSKRPIEQVEHLVIYMQENRALDHYFGSLDGVRGFNDRCATPIPGGRTTLYQPATLEESGYMLPFHVNSLTTAAMCMDAPEMDYPCDIAMVHEGRYDAWNTARRPGMGMSYFNRSDLPYYYALYDSFAMGDHYFQSTYTATNPNRLHLFSGSNGLSVGEEPELDDGEWLPFTWPTMGEILEANNISWKVYQQHDNFDDNAFAWFWNYIIAKPGEPLYDKGMARSEDLIADLEKDMAAGTLPQVSFIVGPTNVSEHAAYHPAAGEDFTARILSAFQKFPKVYAKMALVLDYDEGGQFFDHLWTPNAPVNQPSDGISTVNTTGEVFDFVGLKLPIGLGFRVPLLIVSPWTRGNIVVSEVFDHVSVIKFIENRFNITCPTLSQWRRSVVGDLTSAFDFTTADYSWPVLPNTSAYPSQAQYECDTMPPPEIPLSQTYPPQEPGTKISRALPYEFQVVDSIYNSSFFDISVTVTGAQTGAFLFFDVENLTAIPPRKYTIEPTKEVRDRFTIPSDGRRYTFALYGPNGFVREFGGKVSKEEPQTLQVYAIYGTSNNSIGLVWNNTNPTTQEVIELHDNAYHLPNGPNWTVSIPPSTSATMWFDLQGSGNWYDFTAQNGDQSYQRRFMGRVETGKDTISDPAMAAGVPHSGPGILSVIGLDTAHLSTSSNHEMHPLLPEKARKFKRVSGPNKDSRYYKKNDEL